MRYGDGPNTRHSGKKQRFDPLHEIYRRIEKTKVISKEDLQRLYNQDSPYCAGCRVNLKDSPNCFCGLLPSSGVRKQGLWQRVSDTVADLGPDPSERQRRSDDFPAGLTNLGATCYVNSVLQCLYMNRAFRYGVLSAEPELVEQQPVLYQLSRLFAQLHSGKRLAVDSAAFANTLELDNAVQQDGQEFMKLLLSLLERVLGQSRNPQAQTVVQDVFRGTFSYVTRCSRCGQDSDASKQLVDFYELELNVKGFSSLDESLQDYLSEEKLEGENQYLCELCKVRVDATHCTQLRSLPPVLNFHLKRFVFNSKTATKKKVTSKFCFPRMLDMDAWVSPSKAPSPRCNGKNRKQSLYGLSAILVHKGNLASSGHYVAHVKDECTGQWWQFDDEEVTSLGFHPFGEVPTGTPRKKDTHSNERVLPSCGGESASSSRGLSPSCLELDMLTSSDPYMLMYSSIYQPARIADPGSANQDFSMCDAQHVVGNSSDSSMGKFSLPEQLQHEVDQINGTFMRLCEGFRQRKESALQEIATRKQEVKQILAEVHVEPDDGRYYWISSDWLRNWADSLEPPPPIDNSPLLCPHQNVPPKKLPLMKRISEMAWKLLESKYGGGPTLSNENVCITCIQEEARLSAHADNFRDQRADMREIADAVGRGFVGDGEQYYVSRSWFLQWQKRKPADAPTEADSCPTAVLRCQHGDLLPEEAPGAKRQLVPAKLWQYFCETAALVEGADPRGYQAFEEDSECCAICQVQFKLVASKQEGLRATKIEQRQKHEALYLGKGPIIVPGSSYYLVPSNWLIQWRAYLGASGKNVLKVDEPNGLEAMLLSLICVKHERLAHKPPVLCRTRRGELVQRTSNEDNFTVVSEDDWMHFSRDWDVETVRGVKAFVLDCEPIEEHGFVNSDRNGGKSCKSDLVEGRMEESDVAGAKLHRDDMECRSHPTVPVLYTSPEVCKVCVEELQSRELMNKLNYTNGQITVDLVRGKEPPPSVLAASVAGPEAERRTSKRPRRGTASTSGRATLTVSSETTIYQLKLQIWEALLVVKDNQKLHFGKVELTNEGATLADMNILSGSHLWVMDTGEHENRDIAEEIPEAEFLQPARVEEGFRGTRLLMGGLSNLVEVTNGQYDAIDPQKLEAADSEPLYQLSAKTIKVGMEYVDGRKPGSQARSFNSLDDDLHVELQIMEEDESLHTVAGGFQEIIDLDDMDDSLEEYAGSSKSSKTSDTDRSDTLSRVVNMKANFVEL